MALLLLFGGSPTTDANAGHAAGAGNAHNAAPHWFDHTEYHVKDAVGGTDKTIDVPGVSWSTNDLVLAHLGGVGNVDADLQVSSVTVAGLTFTQAAWIPGHPTSDLWWAKAGSSSSGTIAIATTGDADSYAATVLTIRGSAEAYLEVGSIFIQDGESFAHSVETTPISAPGRAFVIFTVDTAAGFVLDAGTSTPNQIRRNDSVPDLVTSSFYGDYAEVGLLTSAGDQTSSSPEWTAIIFAATNNAGVVAAQAGVAAGSGSAGDIDAIVSPAPVNAAGTGAAQDIDASVAATVVTVDGGGFPLIFGGGTGGGTGTGTAHQPAASFTGQAAVGHASGTGTAHQPTVTFGGTTNAGHASGTGIARDIDAIVGPAAGVAAPGAAAPTSFDAGAFDTGAFDTGTVAGTAGAAHDIDAAIAPTAGVATGTGAANQPTITTGNALASAGHASGSGVSGDTDAVVAPNAGTAAGTGIARQATAAVVKLASAGHASGTGTVHSPSITTDSATNATADPASGAGSNLRAAITLAINPSVASGTGAAFSATTASSYDGLAGHASGTGSAHDATVSVGGAGVNVDAGHAAGTSASYQPTTAVALTSGISTGSGLALLGTTIIAVGPGFAGGSGTAHSTPATGTTAAGHAAGIGTAYNALGPTSFDVIDYSGPNGLARDMYPDGRASDTPPTGVARELVPVGSGSH